MEQQLMFEIITVLFSVVFFSNQPIEGKTVEMQYFCMDHSPQKSIDLKELMGNWYIIEIIHHNVGDRERMLGGYIALDTCPTVFLHQETANNLRLIWTEPTVTLTYIMKKTSAGLWVASGPHNGSLVEHDASSGGSFYYQHHYNEKNMFTGTIEVMKAVGTHTVLTFCKSDHEHSQLFSIILSRERWLTRQEIIGVNNMLKRRGLPAMLTKETCRGYSSANTNRFVLLLVPLWAAAVWLCHT